MTRARRRLLIIVSSAAAALLFAAGALVVTVRSDWFYNKVRERMIAEVERATGGRAEIGRFDFDWKTLQATAGPFVLHGTEGPGEPPLFRAERIRAGMKILSPQKSGVDLSSLAIERPVIHLVVHPDGSTNFPGPGAYDADGVLRKAIRLGVKHFEARRGVVQVNDQRAPFDIRGDNLSAVFTFDAPSQQYKGRISTDAIRIDSPRLRTALLSAAADLSIKPGQVRISNARLAMEHSSLEASGVVRDFSSPRGEFELSADFSIAELGHHAPLPIEHTGEAKLRGRLSFSLGEKPAYELTGRVTGRGLGWRSPDLRVGGIAITADVRMMPGRALFPHFTGTALGAHFSGSAAIEQLERFQIDGTIHDLSLAEVNRLELQKPLPWDAIASGSIHLEGVLERNSLRTISAGAQLGVTPAPGPNPIRGVINLAYDGHSRLMQLGQSHLETGNTRVELSGTVGQTLRVAIRTRDLDDLMPALPMLGIAVPKEIPLRLNNGDARAAGVVIGPLDDPRFVGRVALTAFTTHGYPFDRFAAAVDVTQAHLSAGSLELDWGSARVTGAGSVSLLDWAVASNSSFSASLDVRGVDLGSLPPATRRDLPVHGTASATLKLSGTLARPQGSITVTVDKPSAWGETFDALSASLRLLPDSIELNSGDLGLGDSRLAATGVYRRTGTSWDSGSLTFHVASTSIPVHRLTHVRDFNQSISGRLSIEVAGSGRVVHGSFEPASIHGKIAGRDLALNGTTLGAGEISAEMKGLTLVLRAGGSVRDTKFQGGGEWRLEGAYPGRAEIRFTPLSIATLRDIGVPMPFAGPPPFEGFAEGNIVVSGPLDRPSALTTAITLSRLEVRANPEQRLRAGARAQDLVLRNTEPMRFDLTSQSLTIHSARLAATDTQIEASGRVAFRDKSPWDVTVRGGVNMAIFQMFNADLLARGAAVLNARLQGPLRDPEVNGRLELHNASLYLGALPSGVDNANGVVTFDRDRASIQTLTAELGGGRVALGGFVGFGGSVLLYGVQATAEQVRLRNSEGATITCNAALNLTGSSQKALISGGVTILRAGFAPRTDLGALLAERARPAPAPFSPNGYLRSLSFDVRIESGPGMEFETSLTHDIEAEAELRLRGDAARPVLLGDISITQGDIVLFGSKYEINRGEIRFVNPTRLEPTVDVDLQTRARGITVNISFAGPLNNLKMSYRSDPPLQTNDIIALLAVGRDPMASAGLASSQLTMQSSILSAGPNTITQAMSAPASGRLERFFGVSRLKIDPQLLGVENIPQARLTLEQQVSRDVTITYVTNLSRTQEQIVRLQWDMNRQWSAVATREENGVFGVDFEYKKRFK